MKKMIKYMLFLVVAITVIFSSYKIESSFAEEIYPFDGIISNADGANVNSGPNSGSYVAEIAYGTRFTVDGKSGNFYHIVYDSGKTGYVAQGLVTNLNSNMLTNDVPGIESYRSYCDSLIMGGFTESYCPYLYYLHSKHPNWVFRADRVGISVEDASRNEEGKCSLQTDNENYRIGWNEANYYFVNFKVIAAYLDPRNSMFEANIFQFFDSDDNKDLSSDATLDYLVGNGHLKQYLDAFKSAASSNGINVVQLVSRSKQEGMNNGNYIPVKGTYTTDTGQTYNGNSLDGYYNFYNINTYGSLPFVNGLAYAAGFFDSTVTSFQRPWNSPEKAISGGAEFLASSYIKKGQDTPFYQKFNIASYAQYSKYTHQYMTNIAAPASEGRSMYSTYKSSNSLDQAFVFTIPVYENMSSIPYQAADRSNISTLSNIAINGNTITGFDKDVTEYYLNISTDSNSFDVTVTASNGGGKWCWNNQFC